MKRFPSSPFLVVILLLATARPSRAVVAPGEPPVYDSVEDVSEYADAPWFSDTSIASRSGANRVGPEERHIVNPEGLNERREAILDALYRSDPKAFFEVAASPTSGRSTVTLGDYYRILRTMRLYSEGGLRTLRQHPCVSRAKPGQIWCRHQWMTLPEAGEVKPRRGNLHLLFDVGDMCLTELSFVVFPTEGLSLLPRPDDTLTVDPIRDREPRREESSGEEDVFPPDYGGHEENSEFLDRPRVSSILSRTHLNGVGKTEQFVANPAGLDERREAIIDALWSDDEVAFLRLAASPATGQGGLLNQTFDSISREVKRYRRDPIRMMRAHLIDPDKEREEKSTYWGRHHWMSMPDSKSRTPSRGLCNLIFDHEDFSLSFVRFYEFEKTNSTNVLPYPDASFPNDPVRDRPAAVDR